MHGDDNGSGHVISPQVDSCRSSRQNSGCSSIADPGTPDTHDVLVSPQPGGMEDDGAELFGDENLMVDEVDGGGRWREARLERRVFMGVVIGRL